jgi:phage shock protein PspC (stress-responsive transcriptional regulator)
MTPTRYALTLLRALLALMWCGTAAAGLALGSNASTLQVDPVLMLLSAIIATLSGGTTLAIRVNNLLMSEPPQALVRPWLFVVAHMLGSWLAGLAFFLITRAQEADVWTSLIVVLVSSFTGSKAIEWVAERYLPVVRPPRE